MDHAAAIKEYSRSSADQEEPLPHDLRPLPVLGMTMDYLVTQIMDQGHDIYRDWYDFVWNRTRGIRKVRNASDQLSSSRVLTDLDVQRSACAAFLTPVFRSIFLFLTF